jgi:hypothetical protein
VTPPSRDSDPIDVVRRALAGLRYGEVVIAIHDGEIVQVSRTEKIRTLKTPDRP